MSETPRTDAELATVGRFHAPWPNIEVDFARQLERELAEATKQRDEARECLREAIALFADDSNRARWREAAGLEGREMTKNKKCGPYKNSYGETVVPNEQCDNCDGTGEVHSHNPRCWVCHGSGKKTLPKITLGDKKDKSGGE